MPGLLNILIIFSSPIEKIKGQEMFALVRYCLKDSLYSVSALLFAHMHAFKTFTDLRQSQRNNRPTSSFFLRCNYNTLFLLKHGLYPPFINLGLLSFYDRVISLQIVDFICTYVCVSLCAFVLIYMSHLVTVLKSFVRIVKVTFSFLPQKTH